jgi:hypothetical protein
MTALRLLLASFLAFAAFTASASDKTDLWYNPSESGWGMTLANQGDTIFVTLYVYGADSNPTWFVGTASLTSTDAQGVNRYDGDFYRVTGPFYGGAVFDPNAVNATKVGTYTYRELTATTGQISYSVNGVSYSKNVQRQTLALNGKIIGLFGGAYFSLVSGCTNASFNGTIQSFVTVTVSGAGTSKQVVVAFQNSTGTSCTVSGNYTQAGRFGSMTGTWSCNNSVVGTSTFSEMEGSGNTFSARFQNKFSGCTEDGYLSGGRVFGS